MNPTQIHDTTIIDPTTDAHLRALDAASPITGQDHARADAVLASILATGAEAPGVITGGAHLPVLFTARRHPVRWIAAAAAVGILTTGGLAASTLTATPAYASWTAQPATASNADITAVATACQAKAGTLGDGTPAAQLPQSVPAPPTIEAKDLAVRLGERRGDWIYVLLIHTGADRYEWTLSCLAELPAGSGGGPKHLDYGSTGGGGFAETVSGSQFTQGSIAQFGAGAGLLDGLFGAPPETVSVTEGVVGPEVIGVTIHSRGATVEASVTDGTYAAWWPGKAVTDERPPSGEGGPEPTLTYDLTLKDGTVVKDAKPWRPAN